MKKHPKVNEKKLGRQRAVGQAWKDERIIEIDPRQDAYEYLDTLVHEFLHVEFPDWPENKVSAKSRKLSKFLWRQKYRKVNV